VLTTMGCGIEDDNGNDGAVASVIEDGSIGSIGCWLVKRWMPGARCQFFSLTSFNVCFFYLLSTEQSH
jgi:hypothetical protein